MSKVTQIMGFAAFLAVFLIIYGGAHVFVFWRIKVSWNPGPRCLAGLAVFLTLMALAPILERVAERLQWELLARVLAYAGYVWMGILFLGLAAYLVLGGYRGLLALVDRTASLPAAFRLGDRQALWLALGLAVAVTLYGHWEAWNIRTSRLKVVSAKIPPAVGPVTVVQISDVHLGLIVRTARLNRIAARVREAQPDLLVSTGDLVDGELDDIGCLLQCLREIQPRFGKFAVTGNHEFYAGLPQALEFTRRMGFTVLRGEAREVPGVLRIAGVDDPAVKYFEPGRDVPETEVLGPLPPGEFRLLLKHQPRIDPAALGEFDLQLSGHTHGGQIFPFGFFTRLAYPLGSGFKSLDRGSAVYVSRGSGTWGPPIRFLAPPEITVIELVPAGATAAR